ncbi:ABC transporter substrate-binding protein [Pseudonocardia sp. CA-107938]|uniref:ABC transporter substrate-binding protein n=1 Tax=Pseudonocardia sp. CA-107938 TaxID=3240021 RepID=UPI003D8EB44D
MIRTLAALVAGLVAVAGCATATVPPTPQTTGPTTIRFQSLAFQNPTVAATKRIVADWNAAHPDITVRLNQGSFDSVHNQLVTQFMSGSAPDVIHDESVDITGFARQGYVADLTPYLSPELRAAIPQGLWDTVTVDGRIVGVPIMMQSYVVFANTDLLAGVGVPEGQTLTWDALADLARRATTDTHKGLGWGLRQPTATVMSLGLNFGGGFFSGSGDAVTFAVGDAELEVPRRIHDMAWVDGSLDTTSLTQSGSDVLKGFLNGRYAMIVGGSFLAQQLTETAPPGFHWTVLPALSGSADPTSARQSANPQVLSVAVDSPAIAQSARFVEHVVQPANLAALTQGEWLIPSSMPARAAVAAATHGQNGWAGTLAGAQHMVRAPFQSVQRYPQWKDRIATPALQRYLGNRIDLPTLRAQLTEGWQQVAR